MSQAPTQTEDRPLLGILLMLGFCITAPLGDALAKILGAYAPLWPLVFLRFFLQAILLTPVVLITGRDWRYRRQLLKLSVLRTLLHIAGITMMFIALRYMPLADTIAIAFVMPFILLLLGKVFLNEEVGPRRLIACAVGFAGTLLVIQPSFAEVGLIALLPLGVAVSFALFMLVTRQVAKQTDAVTLQVVSGWIACLVTLPPVLAGNLFGIEALAMPMPEAGTAGLILLLGLLGTGGHLLMTGSLKFAPAATLAPMQYLEIPMATLYGLILFSDLPDGLAALGIAITVGAGLYVIWRERAIARARPSAPGPIPPAPPAA
ncbi:DMT family transporter [Maritimibacter alkaliphilus]|uniref:DMT family transporter n=1 Tax=Maritimibacter alkaliphilus TaxID=404236 RepID=UPI001C96721F|nr:DMT family transporter [Maritimibacter alkaliphilus]MBY6088782.1 DMT family transporter [Maritimibacter alkaliphilus]